MRSLLCTLLDLHSPTAYTFAQTLEYGHGRFPGYAGVGHRLTVLEAGGSTGRDILSALNQVALNHDSHNVIRGISGFELFGLS